MVKWRRAEHLVNAKSCSYKFQEVSSVSPLKRLSGEAMHGFEILGMNDIPWMGNLLRPGPVRPKTPETGGLKRFTEGLWE